MAPGLPGLNAASHAAVESEGACVNAQIQLRPMADKIVGAWVPVYRVKIATLKFAKVRT